jgi:hypothetical protein
MEELNVNEREWAMGFHTNTTIVQGISKGAYRQNLGQIMDFNYLTWIFSLVFGKIIMFWPITPTHSTPSFICCTFYWVNYGSARGVDVTIRQVHHWYLWDYGCQGTFMCVE